MKATRLLTFGLLALSSISLAHAGEVTPKVYDATYETSSTAGTIKMHQISDGKGKMRSETTAPGGGSSISIIDYPNHMSYSILEAQKMIMKTPFKGDASGAPQDKTIPVTDLGSKMINGHMATGKLYKTPQGSTELWLDKASQIMVKSVSKSTGGTFETNVKTLTFNAPDEALFKVPTSGYKVIATP